LGVLWVLLAGIFIALLQKKDLRTLLHLQFRYPWLLITGFAVQIALWGTAKGQGVIPEWTLELAFLIVIAGLAANVRVRGIFLVLLGAALNFIAIATHGGVMPVSPRAWSLVHGSALTPGDSRHSVLTGGDSLWWLTDWIPVIRYIVSPGDVLVGTGLMLFILLNARKRETV
jgi:hypothetical protein